MTRARYALALLVVLPTLVASWNPDAGLVAPLGASVRTVEVSTNNVPGQRILDGNDNTHWQSDACLPTGFISRDEINPVREACKTPERCTASPGSTNLDRATDTSFYTGATIKAFNKHALLSVSLLGPKTVYQVYFRGNWGSGSSAGVARVSLIHTSGAVTTVATVDQATNWKDQVVKGTWDNVEAVQVVSNTSFTLTEVALQAERCFEYATVDMKQVYDVSMIRARWWSPDSLNTSLLISEDGVSWTVLRNDLVPNALPVQELWYETPLQARYLSIRHVVKEDANWRKVYMWELSAYPAGGRWGPAPAPLPQSSTYRQLMGLNGIWGWGSQMFSDSAVKQGVGPLLYNAVASSGRNYQNMNWDVKKPGNDPKWDTMNKTGTDGQWWLDWDREYKAWKGAGLPVDVSYQFGAKDQPVATWGADPYSVSYNLGYKFARHFGPTQGTGNVVSFEAGNEPWDYNAAFYTQVLRGFVEGAYAGDPAVKRLPCALQAHDPLAEHASGGHYIGARVPADLAPKIDALNLHIYSFYNNETGSRVGVHPEHPGSSMNGLHNMLSWRDANMPGTPVWVTEWGWDAARPGEGCGASTECVSQLAQAAYGIRGLALLARKGVAASHWFFYANDDKCETLYCRSGLRDTASRAFGDLPVYRAFNAFMQLAGSASFHAIAKEDITLHVHVLKTPEAAAPTHVLVWRPEPVGDIEAAADAMTETFDVGFELDGAATQAMAAWKLSGAAPDGKVAADVPVVAGSVWTMSVSSIPTLVVLGAAV